MRRFAGGANFFSVMPACQVANARMEWDDVMRGGFSAAHYAKSMFKDKYHTGGWDIVNPWLGVTNAHIGDPLNFWRGIHDALVIGRVQERIWVQPPTGGVTVLSGILP